MYIWIDVFEKFALMFLKSSQYIWKMLTMLWVKKTCFWWVKKVDQIFLTSLSLSPYWHDDFSHWFFILWAFFVGMLVHLFDRLLLFGCYFFFHCSSLHWFICLFVWLFALIPLFSWFFFCLIDSLFVDSSVCLITYLPIDSFVLLIIFQLILLFDFLICLLVFLFNWSSSNWSVVTGIGHNDAPATHDGWWWWLDDLLGCLVDPQVHSSI